MHEWLAQIFAVQPTWSWANKKVYPWLLNSFINSWSRFQCWARYLCPGREDLIWKTSGGLPLLHLLCLSPSPFLFCCDVDHRVMMFVLWRYSLSSNLHQLTSIGVEVQWWSSSHQIAVQFTRYVKSLSKLHYIKEHIILAQNGLGALHSPLQFCEFRLCIITPTFVNGWMLSSST